MTDRRQVVLSLGMGVESTAIALRWIYEPGTCPAPLSDIIVITSMTGNEYLDTGDDMRRHILPLFRQHGIRYVQVARAGMHAEDGITVLSDTRNPTELHLAGDYTLLEYQIANSTVPQYGGEHRCSIKFKADVIEPWLQANVREASLVLHAFGYNTDEQTRVERSEAGIAKRQAESDAKHRRAAAKAAKLAAKGGTATDVAFGFNTDEGIRVTRSRQYDNALRKGLYPLLDWGWDRAACLAYIQAKTGVQWKKSACVFCPFAHNKQSLPDLIARHKVHAEQVSDALNLERVSLSMNHRGQLYSESTLIQLTTSAGNQAALDTAAQKLAEAEWGIYRVRRVYSGKGKADRGVELVEKHSTREAAETRLLDAASDMGREIEFVHGDILRVPLRTREAGVYPTREEHLVSCPAWAMDKCRDMDWGKFELIWTGQWEAKPKRKAKAA